MGKLLLLILLFVSTISFSQSGHLDPSFGNDGIVTTVIGSAFNYRNFGRQVLAQPDGSMYLSYESNEVYGSTELTIIAKKHSDGSADISYGNSGYSTSIPVYESHIALQTDGKLIIAGFTLHYNLDELNSQDLAIARLNTDGNLDNSFGTNGVTTLDFSNNEKASSLAIQGDGKIVVVVIENEVNGGLSYKIVRYNQNGSLDNTFNGTGVVLITEIMFASFVYPYSVAIQSNGKILVAGPKSIGNSYDFEITSFNTDGSIDHSFDGDGMQTINFGPIASLAIQSDGKILIAGDAGSDFAIARYNTNGSLDITFDVDGMQTTNFGAIDEVTSMAIQSDGKIVLAGSTGNGNNNDFAIARYNPDGSLDHTFDGDGKKTADFGSSDDYATSVAIQNDGTILALGYTVNGIHTYVAAASYNTDGTGNNSFNNNGVLIDHVNQGTTIYTGTAIQGDGKILAAGYAWNGTNYDFALVRYNIDGSLDNTFATDGKQMTDFANSNDKPRAMVIQSDGKILVAGSSGNNFAIARYNTDGSLDNTFDHDGILTTDFGSKDSVNSIAVQSDGKILAGGSSGLARYNIDGSLDISFASGGKLTRSFNDNTPFNCTYIAIQNDGKIIIVGVNLLLSGVVARYKSNGSPDNTFGINGEAVFFTPDNTRLVGKSIAIQTDGKIVIGGYEEYIFRVAQSQFLLMRLNTDGTLDGSFNGGNILLSSINLNSYGTSMLIQSDKKIILGGYSYNGSSDDFTLVRYNTDGSLDNTFGENGVSFTQVSTAYDRIEAMALAGDKLYAAGYAQYPGNFGVVARYFIAGGPLPVSLFDFTAAIQHTAVLLKWEISTQTILSGFVIERSADGSRFLTIDSVSASGGNTISRNYSIRDKQPLQGINFYRLKIVDADGKFTYSNIVSVKTNSSIELQIFPNPTERILFVKANGINQKGIVQIVDESGRKIKEMKVYVNGQTSFSMDISSLASGQYNLILHTNQKTKVQPFIKR